MPFIAGDKRGEGGEAKWIPSTETPKKLSKEEVSGIVERANEKQAEQFEAIEKVTKLLKEKSGLSPHEVFEKMLKAEQVPFYQQMLAPAYFFEYCMVSDENSRTLKNVGEMPEDKDEDEAFNAVPNLLAELSDIRLKADDREEEIKARKAIEEER